MGCSIRVEGHSSNEGATFAEETEIDGVRSFSDEVTSIRQGGKWLCNVRRRGFFLLLEAVNEGMYLQAPYNIYSMWEIHEYKKAYCTNVSGTARHGWRG
jgi:hypothetical protein